MSRNSFLKRTAVTSQTRAPKQERELAKRGGGQVTPASGASYQKGDVKKYNGVYRIEAKTTKHDSFRVTRDMIDKIEEAALAHSEIPAIIIEFLDESNRPVREVAVVPTYALNG